MSVNADQAIFQFIGNVTRGSGVIALASVPNGSIAIVNESNVVETSSLASTPTKKVRIVQKGLDGSMYQSPWFSYDQIVSKNRTNYTAASEQVNFVGSDGTTISGLGTVTADNSYRLHVMLKHFMPDIGTSPLVKEVAYKAGASDTQQILAKGLMESSLRTINRGLGSPAIRTERIAAGDTNTQAAFTGTSTIVKLTKGSKSVSVYIKAAAGNTTLTASTATATAGNLLSFPSSNGRSFTFDAVALGTGAGRHVIYIGETAYNVADAGTAAENATAIAAAINAGTQATASSATATVTITYNKDYFGLPPMVVSSDDDSTFTAIAVATASGEATSVKYVVAATATAAATFLLDLPWQGETGYVYEGTTVGNTAGVYTIGANAKWGLKFSGLKQPFDASTATNAKYTKIRFDVFPATNSFGLFNTYTGASITSQAGFDTSVVYAEYQSAKEGVGLGEQIAEQEALVQWQNKNTYLSAYPATVYTREANIGYTYDVFSFVLKEELNSNMIGANPATFCTINVAVKSDLDTNDADVVGTVLVTTA